MNSKKQTFRSLAARDRSISPHSLKDDWDTQACQLDSRFVDRVFDSYRVIGFVGNIRPFPESGAYNGFRNGRNSFSYHNMASLASRTTQAARSAARRAPRSAAQLTLKPAQSSSYSLLARASASSKPAARSSVAVRVTRKLLNTILTVFVLQSVRGVKTLDFAGTKEVVYERSDWPLAKLQDYFKNDTLAMIGYGSQGHGQSLNARDNGLKVIVGVRENGESWKQAQEDGWVRGFSRRVTKKTRL